MTSAAPPQTSVHPHKPPRQISLWDHLGGGQRAPGPLPLCSPFLPSTIAGLGCCFLWLLNQQSLFLSHHQTHSEPKPQVIARDGSWSFIPEIFPYSSEQLPRLVLVPVPSLAADSFQEPFLSLEPKVMIYFKRPERRLGNADRARRPQRGGGEWGRGTTQVLPPILLQEQRQGFRGQGRASCRDNCFLTAVSHTPLRPLQAPPGPRQLQFKEREGNPPGSLFVPRGERCSFSWESREWG